MLRMRETKKSELPVLAIDLGGTKIFTAIISSKGQVIAKERCLTLADEGPEVVINRIFSAIDHFLSQRNIPFRIQIDGINGRQTPMSAVYKHHIVSDHGCGYRNVTAP